jgi:hypothetical protein
MWPAIISTIVGAVAGYASKKAKDKAASAQANTLLKNIQAIKGQVDNNEKDINSAMAEIDTMIGSVSSSLKTDIENNINLSVKNIQGQLADSLAAQQNQLDQLKGTLTDEQEKARQSYSDQISAARENLRKTMVQRRMPNKAFSAKLEEQYGNTTQKMQEDLTKKLTGAQQQADFAKQQMTNEAGRQVASATQAGMSDLTRTMAGLQQQGFNQKQGLAAENRAYKSEALQNIWQLQNTADSLNASANSGALADILGGAASGLGQVTSSLLYGNGSGANATKPIQGGSSFAGLSGDLLNPLLRPSNNSLGPVVNPVGSSNTPYFDLWTGR